MCCFIDHVPPNAPQFSTRAEPLHFLKTMKLVIKMVMSAEARTCVMLQEHNVLIPTGCLREPNFIRYVNTISIELQAYRRKADPQKTSGMLCCCCLESSLTITAFSTIACVGHSGHVATSRISYGGPLVIFNKLPEGTDNRTLHGGHCEDVRGEDRTARNAQGHPHQTRSDPSLLQAVDASSQKMMGWTTFYGPPDRHNIGNPLLSRRSHAEGVLVRFSEFNLDKLEDKPKP